VQSVQYHGAEDNVSQLTGDGSINSPQASLPQGEPAAPQQPIINNNKVGRNDPCPCGKINPETGKPLKYKNCCGK